jgi:prepilin-type N-terminal cleavage/methylation domain-containing protein
MFAVNRRRCPFEAQKGFSLVEVLLALAITLIVMAMVTQTMASMASIYRRESDVAVSSQAVALALDDVTYELSLAGQGLGEGPAAVLPRVASGPVSSDALTIRSNPAVAASFLGGDVEEAGKDVPAVSAAPFEKGMSALLTDAGGGEAAEIVRAEDGFVALRSLESSDGTFRRSFAANRGARLLGLREVRYFLDEPREDGRRDLVKEVVGVGRRVLSRDVVSLEFQFLDPDEGTIAPAKVESSSELRSVRVILRYLTGRDPLGPSALATRVALEPRSADVDFERRDLGFHLSRVFFPLDHPAAVASRIGADWAVILASGASPTRDPAYLYTFELEKKLLGASADDVVHLDDVRAPTTMTFAPEGGPMAGSLFIAAWGLRVGHISRIEPDEFGKLSSSSVATTFEGTDAIAQAGGIAFGVDDALYVTSLEKGAIYRFRFLPNGKPQRPERLFPLSGAPGALVEGTDGHLYFVMNQGDRGSLWKMAFDETLAPVEPVSIGALPGEAIALARDPVSGDLFALVRNPVGDSLVIELGPAFLKGLPGKAGEPKPVFSFREWRTSATESRLDPREMQIATEVMSDRLAFTDVQELDSLSFDALGSLYTGNRDASLVLKFELDRPSGRYAVGLAAGVVERGAGLAPEIRMHAWKKRQGGS